MKRADTDSNAVIDLNEFIKYMMRHEHKLFLAFTSLDKNSDGELPTQTYFFLNESVTEFIFIMQSVPIKYSILTYLVFDIPELLMFPFIFTII
jgi:hypothetical protein